MGDIYRTDPADAVLHPSGWSRCGDVDVLALPMVDRSTGLFARLSYADLELVAVREGGRLVSMDTLLDVWEVGLRLEPVTLVASQADTRHMQSKAFCERHDRTVMEQLAAMQWNGQQPVANAGKQWIRGASPGKARNGGWFVRGKAIQPGGPGSEHHDRANYTDYSQLALLERDPHPDLQRNTDDEDTMPTAPDTDRTPSLPPPARRTIRRGSTGADVLAWQVRIGVGADGNFGPRTEAVTKVWQQSVGLVADGVVGARSWAAAGETWVPAVPSPHGPAPACLAALRDATAAWPMRRRTSDGIMGDARHMATGKAAGHNIGNAVDISHDPGAGCDAARLSLMAMTDARVQYIIYDRHIWNVDRSREGWRVYSGANPHTAHVHIEIKPTARDDAGPWPWAPGQSSL
jgi:peptidoglycan hydrolase-like protein with peptidoglycan-binding domain